MANSVSVRVGAPGAKQASSEVDKLRDSFTKLQHQGAKGLAIGAGVAAATKAFSLVGSAIGEVTGFLGDSVNAYREQEVASNRLNASLKANIAGWHDSSAAIEDANKASMELGFTDTETTNALSLLAAATHDQAEALKVLAVAQDLARFKGISLADAAQALTSIEAGRSRGLAQLGINVKDFATTEQRLAAVEKVAGGQARAYASTDLGALDKATAKVDQAQEKFGQGMSHLGAVVLPAAADGVSTLADKLDDLFSTSFDKGATSVADLNESLHFLFGRQVDLGFTTVQLNAAFADQVQTQVDAALATGKTADAEGMLGIAMRDGAAAADRASGSMADLADATVDVNHAFTSAQAAMGEFDSTLKAMEAAQFGAKITAGDLAQAHKDLGTILKEKPQKKSGQEWDIWQGKVASARQALFDLQYQEKEQEGPKALYDWLLKEQTQLGHTTEKANDYLVTLRALALLSSNMPPVNFVQNYTDPIHGKTGPQKFAQGGIVKAKPGGTLAIIGEAGEDEAVVPIGKGSTAGKLTAAMGGSGTIVNINVHGVSVLTPGAAEELARRLEPVITRAQQRRGLSAAPRAF